MNRKTIINRPLDVFRKAMLFLLLCVLIASCSKEDVITEETGITGTPHFTWGSPPKKAVPESAKSVIPVSLPPVPYPVTKNSIS